jgi:pyruvate/2-oxoglutarate/acetoin dehydrogenase E1 component
VPGLKVVAPATLADARGMLWSALLDPDPVVMFEHATLYNLAGELPADAGVVPLEGAAVRRAGRDVTVITYGGSLGKCLEAAERLAADGLSAEVIDLRCLRPLDRATLRASVARTHRAVLVDESWKTCGLAAELMACLVEDAFYDLDAPPVRVCSAEVPIPYPKHLEDAALPQVGRIVAAAHEVCGRAPEMEVAPRGAEARDG